MKWFSDYKELNLIKSKPSPLGYHQKLLMKGVGYKCFRMGEWLLFDLGYTHYLSIVIPKGIEIIVKKTTLFLSAKDLNLLSRFSFQLKSLKDIDPYKGKGIRFHNEVITLKTGKVRS